jgi:predicted DNA-binding protein (UPF0251 family)
MKDDETTTKEAIEELSTHSLEPVDDPDDERDLEDLLEVLAEQSQARVGRPPGSRSATAEPLVSAVSETSLTSPRGSKNQSKDLTYEVLSNTSLTPKQLLGVRVLIEASPTDTREDLARRIGISRVTLWQWLTTSEFRRVFNALLSVTIDAAKGKTLQSLIRGANTVGPQQAQMQKVFWTLAGSVSDRIEVSGPNGEPLQVETKNIDVDSLPMVVKKLIYHAVKGGSLSHELEARLNEELDLSIMEAIDV